MSSFIAFIRSSLLLIFGIRNIKTSYLGSTYGGWVVSTEKVAPGDIVYSFGVGTDISFDLEMISKHDATIFAFDPTPKSHDWIQTQSVPEAFHYFDYGIAEFDGELLLYPPENVMHVSYSRFPTSASSIPVSFAVKTLSTIMTMLSHEKLSILKMDIEGAEYGVLPALLSSCIRPQQILVEFHHRFQPRLFIKTIFLILRLFFAGYRIMFVSEKLCEFSFVRIQKG